MRLDPQKYMGYVQGWLKVVGHVPKRSGNVRIRVKCSGGKEGCKDEYEVDMSYFIRNHIKCCMACSRRGLGRPEVIRRLDWTPLIDRVYSQKWGWGEGRFSYYGHRAS